MNNSDISKTTGMSLQLPRSDQPVCFTAEVGSVGPPAIASAVAEPLFPHSWNSSLPIPGGYDHFQGCFYLGVAGPDSFSV